MGLLVRNLEHNGLELKDVYVGVELLNCSPSSTTCRLKLYSSTNRRAKKLTAFSSYELSFNFTTEQLSTIPLYKLIYIELKEMFGDCKDVKDFDKVKTPVISSTEINTDNIVISGSTSSEDDVIESIFPVARSKKTFTIVVPITDYKEKYVGMGVFIKAEQADMEDSDYVQLFNKERIDELLYAPIAE